MTDEQSHAAPAAQVETGLDEAIRALLPSARMIELAPDALLVRQGETADSAFFLDEGSVQVYAETAYGATPLATLQAPRLIGEIGAFAGLPRTASIRAATPARLFEIRRAQLLELGVASPKILLAALEQLGRQIASVNEALALYSDALAALEKREFDSRILADLDNPPPALAAFASAFRRFANEIVVKRRQQDEMASAALIQQSFLPKETALNKTRRDIEIAGKIRPTREVGGDFYDFFRIDDNRLALAIGDVCGKGPPASLFAAIVVTLLRTIGRDQQDVGDAVNRANRLLCEDNDAAMFATVFFGVLDLRSGELRYVNCGHVAPVHLSAQGAPRRLASTGLPLGIDADCVSRAAACRLDPGDKLILITDGVTEAMNAAMEEFGDARFVEAVERAAHMPPSQLLTALVATVDDFVGGVEQADDIGCLVMERKPSDS
ncbi:MAG: PP2C family protein-serine/threonine phosphatase [Methylocystis sp.]|uniref:PP2C family protein-serine/threonine phosphatase n=1 Tax=Methylocystis sp. TaxID=1911079 RepID=UPI003DA30653